MKSSWFTVKQIKPSIWGIGEFQDFEEVISFLIVGRKRALLLDSGMGKENIKDVVKTITNKPVTLINTHSHYDHIGNNDKFEKKIPPNAMREGKLISINPFLFRILCTPGHSPDSICLYEEKAGYLFTGDTIYPGPIYLHLPESNISEYKKSIKKIVNLPYLKTIFPSHNAFTCSITLPKRIAKIFPSIDISAKSIMVDDETSLLLQSDSNL